MLDQTGRAVLQQTADELGIRRADFASPAEQVGHGGWGLETLGIVLEGN